MTDRPSSVPMTFNTHLARFVPLAAGWSAGAYDLPAELVNDLTGIVALHDLAASLPVPEPAVNAQTRWVAAAITASTAGTALPDLAGLSTDLHADADALAQVAAVRAAMVQLSSTADGYISNNGAAIFDGYLWPVFSTTFATAATIRGALAPLGPVITAEVVLASADPTMISAWNQLPGLAATYAVLRAATVALDESEYRASVYGLTRQLPLLAQPADLLAATYPNPIGAAA